MLQKLKSSKQFSNLIIYGIGQGFNLVTPLLVVPYIGEICGQGGYGRISMGFAMAFFLIVVVDYGIDITGVKEVAVNRDDKTKLSRLIVTIYAARFLLLCGVIALAAVLFCTVPYFIKEKELCFFSLTILVGQFINPTWVFQGIENFKGIAFLNILSKLIYVMGVFTFVKQPEDYVYVNLCWGTGMIIANLISAGYLWRTHDLSISGVTIQEIGEYIKSNFSIFISQIFVSVQLYFPVLLIGFLSGDVMAGKYRIVEQVIVIFKTYIFLFFNYVYPRICYLLEKSKDEALRFWKLYNGANFIFITTCMAVLLCFARYIISYFKVEDEYIAELTGILRLGILLPLLLAVSIPLKQLILGIGEQKYYVRLSTGMTVFNIALLIILLSFMDLYGAWLSLIITEVITVLFYASRLKKRLFGHLK